MSVYYCVCGFANKYDFDRPKSCVRCSCVFAKAFASVDNYNLDKPKPKVRRPLIAERVEDIIKEEETDIPVMTQEDVEDILIESGTKSNKVTVADILSDKGMSLTADIRERPEKINVKKESARILGEAKSINPATKSHRSRLE